MIIFGRIDPCALMAKAGRPLVAAGTLPTGARHAQLLRNSLLTMVKELLRRTCA
jgi:hypothetical protein